MFILINGLRYALYGVLETIGDVYRSSEAFHTLLNRAVSFRKLEAHAPLTNGRHVVEVVTKDPRTEEVFVSMYMYLIDSTLHNELYAEESNANS